MLHAELPVTHGMHAVSWIQTHMVDALYFFLQAWHPPRHFSLQQSGICRCDVRSGLGHTDYLTVLLVGAKLKAIRKQHATMNYDSTSSMQFLPVF